MSCNPITLAQAIPMRWRQGIYSVLATLILLEGVVNVIPDTWDGKVLSILAILGFGVSLSNTSQPLPPPPPEFP